MFFEKKVDLRSRKAMEEFLRNHFSYYNLKKSYANKVKIHYLGLTSTQLDKAFNVILAEDFWEEISWPIDVFTKEQNGSYTICSAGRSGGYLVLHHSRFESTGYLSRCRTCGQKFYKSVAEKIPEGIDGVIARQIMSTGSKLIADYVNIPEIVDSGISATDLRDYLLRLYPLYENCTIDNVCGRCGASGEKGRINYQTSPKRLRILSGVYDHDLAELSTSDLREQVRLVQAFDRACDQIRAAFIDLIDNCKVVDDVRVIKKPIKRLICYA